MQRLNYPLATETLSDGSTLLFHVTTGVLGVMKKSKSRKTHSISDVSGKVYHYEPLPRDFHNSVQHSWLHSRGLLLEPPFNDKSLEAHLFDLQLKARRQFYGDNLKDPTRIRLRLKVLKNLEEQKPTRSDMIARLENALRRLKEKREEKRI